MASGDFSRSMWWMLFICSSFMREFKCEGCPSRCLCSSAEGKDLVTPLVSCSGIFPSRVPRTVSHLVVSSANLSTLTAAAVSPLGKLLSLHIISSGISSVEENAFSGRDIVNLRDLRLSNNEIPYLGNGTFANLHVLEELFLDGNNMRSIAGILSNLTELQVLHLESNYLEEVPHNLPLTLTELFLSNNNIHTVNILGIAPVSLKYLDLCDNSFAKLSYRNMTIPENLENLCLGTQFYDMDPQIFSSQGTSLRTLTLKTTKKLTSRALDAINKLRGLKSLTISGAKITRLAGRAFNASGKLQSLSLVNMKCSPEVDQDFFSFYQLRELDLSRSSHIANMVLSNQVYLKNLLHLKTLKVRDTSISEINDDIMPFLRKLEQLDISENHLKCDCNLNWIIKKSHKGKLYLFHSDETRCYQESTLETYLILDKRLRIPNCEENEEEEQVHHDHDSSKMNSHFYIIVCLMVIIAALFIAVVYLLVKYLKSTRRKRCVVSTIF